MPVTAPSIKPSATPNSLHPLERPAPSDKFGTLEWVIRESYRMTKFASLSRVNIQANAAAVTVSGKVDSYAEEYWARTLAERFARGIPVVVQVQVQEEEEGKANISRE